MNENLDRLYSKLSFSFNLGKSEKNPQTCLTNHPCLPEEVINKHIKEDRTKNDLNPNAPGDKLIKDLIVPYFAFTNCFYKNIVVFSVRSGPNVVLYIWAQSNN